MLSKRLRIFVVAEAYAPAFKAGGPVRSLVNLVEWLGDEYDFHVYTRDRDLGDAEGFAGIAPETWERRGRAWVWYASPARFCAGLAAAIRSVQPDLVYMNSFFAASSRHLLWQRRWGRVFTLPTLLAPRGELQAGALAQRALKKRIYLSLCRAMRLLTGVHFHATARSEIDGIREQFGPDVATHLAANLPGWVAPVPVSPPRKEARAARFVYCSRVVPKKNLLFFCESLAKLRGQIEVTILGPREDEAYARQIDERVAKLPANVSFRWGGIVAHELIPAALANHHFFVLPTLAENYGHAIVEAWQAGLPVVISDRTPWRDLAAKGAGWDLPLEAPQQWTEVLQRCVDLDQEAYAQLRARALRLAEDLQGAPPLDDWRALFRAACA